MHLYKSDFFTPPPSHTKLDNSISSFCLISSFVIARFLMGYPTTHPNMPLLLMTPVPHFMPDAPALTPPRFFSFDYKYAWKKHTGFCLLLIPQSELILLLTEQSGQFPTRLEHKLTLWTEGTPNWGFEVMNLHRETWQNLKSRVQVGVWTRTVEASPGDEQES